MKNSIQDLNNYLFEQMERIMEDGISDEELERELKKTDAVTRISGQIINNAELVYKSFKLQVEMGYDAEVPKILEDKDA